MRNISLSLAALALVLAGSLGSVAQAETEYQHRQERSDLAYATQAVSQTQAAVVAESERQNREERSDLASAAQAGHFYAAVNQDKTDRA
jgi:hypothetical protein